MLTAESDERYAPRVAIQHNRMLDEEQNDILGTCTSFELPWDQHAVERQTDRDQCSDL